MAMAARSRRARRSQLGPSLRTKNEITMPTAQHDTKPIKRVLYDILHNWLISSMRPSPSPLLLPGAPASPSLKNFLNLS